VRWTHEKSKTHVKQHNYRPRFAWKVGNPCETIQLQISLRVESRKCIGNSTITDFVSSCKQGLVWAGPSFA